MNRGRRIHAICSTAFVAPLLFASAAFAQPRLDAGYGNGMVVQRDAPIVFSGTAEPGESVEGRFGEAESQTRADTEGRFVLTFPAREADLRPSNLRVSAASGNEVVSNILIGDVFLCSGQSNMEFAVERALNAWSELRSVNDDRMRLRVMPKTTAAAPQTTAEGSAVWRGATSASVGPFSAACYYMGKKLRSSRPDVPVGLIHSSWGGSAASAWLTPEHVALLHGEESLELLKLHAAQPRAALNRFASQWYSWWQEKDNGRTPWSDSAALEWSAVPGPYKWNDWRGSGLDTQPRANVWLRQKLTVSSKQARTGGTLSLGGLEDLDQTWINGQVVGNSFGWGSVRRYEIGPDDLNEGENEILVAIFNGGGPGGFVGSPDLIRFEPADESPAISLKDGWEYHRSAVNGSPPRAPWDANSGLGVMHNAMIAPLGQMRLAGVAWYQGETDIGRGDYEPKLAALFEGWRGQFGQQAKMMVVQLADFGARTSEPVGSGWAELRQDQMEAVIVDPNAALVTAIDLGEPTDIHPANKNVIGERLAAAMLGQAMPMPATAELDDNTIIVRFDGVEGALGTYGGDTALGIELCGTTQASCRFVSAHAMGDTLVIELDSPTPGLRVRHAWSDAPIVNVFDSRGMALPGFEITVTDKGQ